MLVDCFLLILKNSRLHLGMPFYQFPSEIVYWTRVEEHESIKSKILQKIEDIQTTEKLENPFDCTMTTNFGMRADVSGIHNFLDEECIQKMFVKPFREFLKDTNVFQIRPKSYEMYEYWFNKYEKGDFQELHTHSMDEDPDNSPTLSGVYILKSGDEPNSTSFEINNEQGIPFHPTKKNVVFDTSNIDDITEGIFMIFSSTLSHKVKPIKTGGRVTIAFNVACKYE
jgi:hypothetical protein